MGFVRSLLGGTNEAHSLDYHPSHYWRCHMGRPVYLLLYLGDETVMPDDDYLDEARLMADDNWHDSEEPGICPACNGSGEGQHEGTTCCTCKGEGEI